MATRVEELERVLAGGPKTSRELQGQLGVSQATVSRLLDRTPSVLTLGSARKTIYALARALFDDDSQVPIFEVDEHGKAHPVATLMGIQRDAYWVDSQDPAFPQRIEMHLPFYLEDMKPAGFLGRLVPRTHPDLGLPSDIRMWSDGHALAYFAKEAWDAPGNLVVGDPSFQLFLQNAIAPKGIAYADRGHEYDRIANEALFATAGSSARGEQPKFLSSVVGDHGELTKYIVKFSPRLGTSAAATRVADLLLAEHVALSVLQKHGFEVSQTQVFQSNTRRYLEVTRFDRSGSCGRRGVVSLATLGAEFSGDASSWSATARDLFQQRILTRDQADRLVWLDVYGRLIANTDRHWGNVSFMSRGTNITGLAPVYDMSPAMYAPREGEILPSVFNPGPPDAAELAVWSAASAAALDFWKRYSAHDSVSESMKQIACENFEKVETLVKQLGRHVP